MATHRIAGIDVHKKMLAVVVLDAAEEGEWTLHRRKFLTTSEDLDALADWLGSLQVQEAVMESTAQYWKPVWRVLEPQCHLELAQAQSNRGPRGRKNDFGDAERLVRRYLAGELILSFVPDPRQRLWRALSRAKQTAARDRVRLHNRVEALLEEMCLKLSSVVSDLLGVSARRMLAALTKGETDPAKLAALAEPELRATPEQLCDALRAAPSIHASYRELLKQYLEKIEMQDRHIADLERELAAALKPHEDAVVRLAKTPGLGADSAQQIIAEVGPQAAKFPAPENLCSWVGTCTGQEESAGESHNDHSPKGNHSMRRILNQAAQAAVKSEGTVFQAHYRRIRGRDPKKHNVAIWAVANRLCRLIWKILHEGVSYEERGNRPNLRAVRHRASRLVRQLRALGYSVQVSPPQPQSATS